MNSVVLDASAVLALLWEERGSDVVAEAIEGAAISAVNVAEVIAKLAAEHAPDDDAVETVEALRLDVVAFDIEQAGAVGVLRRRTARSGLSLGDRACLHLGRLLDREVLTADRSWAKLDIGVRVRVIR